MLRTTCALLLSVSALSAAEEPAISLPRLVGEALVGSAGFELGVAAEWTQVWGTTLRLRPEVLFNGANLPGLAASVTFPIAEDTLPANQSLWIGPRLVFHNDRYDGGKNDDDLRYGFGAECVVFYNFAIVPSQPGRHSLSAIGALGLVDHHSDTDVSLTIGAAYGYQF